MSAPRAMIVDDNTMNVELVTFLLEGDGFCVAATTDAMRALAEIAAFVPDVVLMDIQMPGIDGLALTRQLREDPALQAIVVIAFTAYAMKGDEEKMRAAGCDGYIAKPIDVGAFADTVRAYL